jgi:hypothetical protein
VKRSDLLDRSENESPRRLTPFNPQQPSQQHKQHKQNRAYLERIPPPGSGIHVGHSAQVQYHKSNRDQRRHRNWKHAAMDLQMPAAQWAAEKPAQPSAEEGPRNAQLSRTNRTSMHKGLSSQLLEQSYLVRSRVLMHHVLKSNRGITSTLLGSLQYRFARERKLKKSWQDPQWPVYPP